MTFEPVQNLKDPFHIQPIWYGSPICTRHIETGFMCGPILRVVFNRVVVLLSEIKEK